MPILHTRNELVCEDISRDHSGRIDTDTDGVLRMDEGEEIIISSENTSGHTESQSAQNAEIFGESLVPLMIGLVCGIILVLTCFIISFVFIRKYDRRQQSNKRRREPELLSYCSTVDSYRAGIIWGFESRRNVHHFLTKIIDKSLMPARNVFSSIRSSRDHKDKSFKSCDSSRHIDSEHTSDQLCSGSTSTSSGNQSKLMEKYDNTKMLNMSAPYSIYDQTLPDVSSYVISLNAAPEEHLDRANASHVAVTSSAEHIYEEIPINSIRGHASHYDDNSLNGGYAYDDGVQSHEDRLSDATKNYSFRDYEPPFGYSSRSIDTIGSSEMSHERYENALDNLPASLKVISLSEMSINIRSCPDSPLCSTLSQTNMFSSASMNITKSISVVSDIRYPGSDRTCAPAFSTTILDMVQGEARKRGLVKDSLVHGRMT